MSLVCEGWTGDPIFAQKEMLYLAGVVRGLASGVIGKPTVQEGEAAWHMRQLLVCALLGFVAGPQPAAAAGAQDLLRWLQRHV